MRGLSLFVRTRRRQPALATIDPCCGTGGLTADLTAFIVLAFVVGIVVAGAALAGELVGAWRAGAL